MVAGVKGYGQIVRTRVMVMILQGQTIGSFQRQGFYFVKKKFLAEEVSSCIDGEKISIYSHLKF